MENGSADITPTADEIRTEVVPVLAWDEDEGTHKEGEEGRFAHSKFSGEKEAIVGRWVVEVGDGCNMYTIINGESTN